MQIDSERLDREILRINLSGRLDVAGVKEIEGQFTALTAAPSKAVIVDLSKVAFLASIGIRVLLVNAKELGSRGGRMALLSPDATVTKVLELSGIDRTIGVFRDLETACAAVTAAPEGPG